MELIWWSTVVFLLFPWLSFKKVSLHITKVNVLHLSPNVLFPCNSPTGMISIITEHYSRIQGDRKLFEYCLLTRELFTYSLLTGELLRYNLLTRELFKYSLYMLIRELFTYSLLAGELFPYSLLTRELFIYKSVDWGMELFTYSVLLKGIIHIISLLTGELFT